MYNDTSHNPHTSGVSRRRFLQWGLAAGAAAMLPPGIARARNELTLLSWYGHAEPEVVGAFEERFNVRVRSKYYVGGDQMLALLAQSPPGTYDVILTDAEFVQQLRVAGYIQTLQPSDYPFDDYFPEFQQYPAHWHDGDLYSVMLRFGYLGLSYNRDVLSEQEASSYGVMWADKLKGLVGHFDWYLPNYGCISLLEGNRSPFDISDAAWRAVHERTMSLKPQVAGFFDYGGVLASLRSGQVAAVPGIGDWITGVLQRDGANVTTAIPEEGGLQWTESLSIARGARNPELAKRFIQYMTSPEGQVRSATMRAYPALLPTRTGWQELNRVNPEEARRQGMVFDGRNALSLLREGRITPRRLPVQQSIETWNEAWSEYKNA
ncbi:polyamine ABC transporter substrate-binding protein [Spiribacter halobius]|uniref:ABC transporter substrate-binding protein n=1 Tax=Sediminicurvatus halobius TaxID=2182432 RepID=A0A2U2MXZ3_9GAMM|nr:spermidine/putrescine ABC transporter substrate-binding protein [Spiribacter halobius]PWG61816.1 ABC transporter substrate-binding protein [Spiribacter halobius]UEX77656.1 spermidine/putrescine ABC transporter substrate-binding protein [Spiribacter halobius]